MPALNCSIWAGDFQCGIFLVGDAPKKGQHFSGGEMGQSQDFLANPFEINYKLDGVELGRCAPFQSR